jgi:hypothetical protein
VGLTFDSHEAITDEKTEVITNFFGFPVYVSVVEDVTDSLSICGHAFDRLERDMAEFL